jgi:hypothetical protein
VSRYTKLLEQVLNGRSDATIRFSDLVQLLLRLGFSERSKAIITSSREMASRKC